jgi:hypothetical protein
MPARLIRISQTQPAKAILMTVTFITLIAGLFLFTPWFVPFGMSPVAAAAFGTPALVGAAINTVATFPALHGLKQNTPEGFARGAFWLFLWYLFVTIARILLQGAATLTFVTPLIIALIMAIIYIEQTFVSKGPRVKEGVVE